MQDRRPPPLRRRHARGARRRGQSREGCGGAGGAEHEPDVRFSRGPRPRADRRGSVMRGIGRRLRSSFGIGSSRMAIRSQLAWYWRWMLNVLMMVVVGAVVWWLVQNSYRITGFDIEEVRHQIAALTAENAVMKHDLETAKVALADRDRQLQIEKAALKEDLGFLRNIMSSGTTPEGLGISNLKIERDVKPTEFRYRMLLTQGGQRKQDFKGKVQIVARIAKDGAASSLTFPDSSAGDAAGVFEFRFYQKVEGRFAIPEGATLKGVDVRVLAFPGGQVKMSRTVNQL